MTSQHFDLDPVLPARRGKPVQRRGARRPPEDPKRRPTGGGRGSSLAAPERFDAREVLQRTGWRVRDEGGAARSDLAAIGDGLSKIGGGDFTGAVGQVALVLVGGLLGLILLNLLLGKNSVKLASAGFGWLGSSLRRLVDPTDPLTEPGSSTAAPAKTTAASGKTPAVVQRAESATVPIPSGKIETVPGSSASLDSAYVAVAQWIEKTFGVSITSGYRSASHNAAVGGVSDSAHLKGLAADFAGPAAAMERLVRWAQGEGFPYVETPAQAEAAGEGAHVHITFFKS